MFTFMDKAYMAAMVSFLSLTAMQFWGIEISPTAQNGIVGLLTGIMTYWIPNKYRNK